MLTFCAVLPCNIGAFRPKDFSPFGPNEDTHYGISKFPKLQKNLPNLVTLVAAAVYFSLSLSFVLPLN